MRDFILVILFMIKDFEFISDLNILREIDYAVVA